MIRAMAKAPKKQKNYVRPTPEAWHAMKRVLTAMQSPSLFGKNLLQEDFIAATWLWMAEMDAERIADGVRPHVAAVQAYWLAVGEQGDPAEGANVVEKLIGPEASAEHERTDQQRPPGAKPKAPRKGRA